MITIPFKEWANAYCEKSQVMFRELAFKCINDNGEIESVIIRYDDILGTGHCWQVFPHTVQILCRFIKTQGFVETSFDENCNLVIADGLFAREKEIEEK